MPLLAGPAAKIVTKDQSYRRVVNKFVKHVDETDGLSADAHGHYATPANIASFFEKKIQVWDVQPDSAACARPALQALISAEQCPDHKALIIRQVLIPLRATVRAARNSPRSLRMLHVYDLFTHLMLFAPRCVRAPFAGQ